ncbi:MAG: glycosyltransferase family 39 protein [Candidatus Omnitrophica bacterium]|nr:glycosyltransferase family 39 protein [Candidatus Omnitrophota bacterium]
MQRYKSCAAAIFIFFCCFYAIFCIGHFGGDGYGDYLTAESIVLDGNLSLYDRPGDVDQINYGEHVTVLGRDGKLYSSRGGLGVPIILSLFYLAGHLLSLFLKSMPHDFITNFVVSFANPLITAFCCLLIFVISSNLKFKENISLFLTFIFGLSTMAIAYIRTGFPDSTLMLFMLLSMYFLIKFLDSRHKPFLILAAFSLSYMVFVKPYALIFVFCFIAYFAWKINGFNSGREKLNIMLVLLLSLFLFISLIFIYNWYIFGSFLKFGGGQAAKVSKRILESGHFLKGMYYYLFSSGKSFWLFNLPLILSFWGLCRVSRERRKEGVLFFAIFAINLLFFVKSFRRGSLFSWGPRYLLPSIPFLIFLLGELFENYRGIFVRAVASVLSFLGFLIVMPTLFINQSKFYFFVKNELHLDEYLINFIPDLSPISGAWKMFISRIILSLKSESLPYIFNPDYRLVNPISGFMDKYNSFDSWFLKISNLAPAYSKIAYLFVFLLAVGCVFSLSIILKQLYLSVRRKSC